MEVTNISQSDQPPKHFQCKQSCLFWEFQLQSRPFLSPNFCCPNNIKQLRFIYQTLLVIFTENKSVSFLIISLTARRPLPSRDCKSLGVLMFSLSSILNFHKSTTLPISLTPVAFKWLSLTQVSHKLFKIFLVQIIFKQLRFSAVYNFYPFHLVYLTPTPVSH